MTFGQCIEEWKRFPGKAFRRASWPEEEFVEAQGGLLYYHEDGGHQEQFAPFLCALSADDWEEC